MRQNKNINNLLTNNLLTFLKKFSFLNCKVEPITSDASNRKYYRIFNESETFILMDSSKEKKSIENFIEMSKWLVYSGLKAPKIIKKDLKYGFLLLEDLGKKKFSTLVNNLKLDNLQLYFEATNILIHIYNQKLPDFLKPYSMKIMLIELELFISWYCLKRKPALNDNAHKEWTDIWTQLLSIIPLQEKTVTLRDYHADNIMYLNKNSSLKKLGLLDFQDALIGHPSYDLVSLLQDVRVKVPILIEKKMKLFFLKNCKINKQDFHKSYSIIATQRIIKIIGIFHRLALRDKKTIYLQYLPYAWSLLERNLSQKPLYELKKWFENYIPNH